GAGHIGETGFAAGVFYSYLCIDREQLIENLGGDQALADRSIQALIEAAVKVAPRGKQNSFGSRAYASYVLAEKGAQQPRSLSVAFLKPVKGQGEDSIQALERQMDNFDRVYGACADDRCSMNALQGYGSLDELKQFVAAG
ncbi:type I-E CRISPR-associated protein Cas7/Cse4/CasC, partial [Thioalkalivibrio sp.]|uniref:type I-E CRISPR-associated protein Cas7/Cse4/CasC n=1 Tax=Thioalkalivibrio sp. TaxID=2093813 RepID=UPI003564FE23